ncbi:DUF4114 domain-containing protein [Labilibaculum sp.]|uniref:DUF4114 domain-containing protein n=1 Tax=Labilibaculum sp. TaxID=2060723 RepID=UPI0035650464
MKKYLLGIMGLAFLISSCSDDNDVSQQSDLTTTITENITINNNTAELSSRVSQTNSLVIINDITSSSTINAKDATDSDNESFDVDYTKNYAFTLKAEVECPTINGTSVQATHVKISDDLAFVSYNTKGSEYSGGVEVFNISDEDNPTLQAQVLISNVDVSAVDYYDGVIYLVGAIDPATDGYGLDSPAILVSLELSSSNEIAAVLDLIDLPSYVATDIAVDENYIYTTSGSDGNLTILDRSDNSILSETSISDARSLSINSDNIYVLGATNSVIRSFQKSDFSELTSIDLDYDITSDSKTEIDVSDDYILAAMNESGLDILDIDGTLKEHFDRPTTPENGNDANYVTNSVSLNDELLLIGNGGAGVYVGAMVPENNDEVTMLGSMDFDASVNYVKSKGDYIFVAAGTGGLKIITIGIDNGVPDDVIETKPCETLVDDIIEMFPEREDNSTANSELFSDDNNLILKLVEESPVYLTFIYENAGWKNSLAYYTYDADDVPESADDVELHMLFENVSMVDEGGGLSTGDRVQLGDSSFPANTVIGFCLIANGWNYGATGDGNYKHYTNTEWNTDGNQQHVLFKESTCEDLVLSFEDVQLPSGDKDYNDIIFTINDNEEDANVATAFDLTDIVVK